MNSPLAAPLPSAIQFRADSSEPNEPHHAQPGEQPERAGDIAAVDLFFKPPLHTDRLDTQPLDSGLGPVTLEGSVGEQDWMLDSAGHYQRIRLGLALFFD
jgi:hypothetical protein